MALEATTGRRFVVEELHAIGAAAHLAEPAETAARRATKKRAKTDRADARHPRELLMIGRLPESWISARSPPRSPREGPPASHAGRSARRVAAAHPGGALPPRLPAAKRVADRREPAWLEHLSLPETAHEQIAVALAMIDALDAQSAPITRELRLDARRQPGCRALMKHYGIGELTAVTILAELGLARKLLKRSFHTLRELGDEGLLPA